MTPRNKEVVDKVLAFVKYKMDSDHSDYIGATRAGELEKFLVTAIMSITSKEGLDRLEGLSTIEQPK